MKISYISADYLYVLITLEIFSAFFQHKY